LSLMPKGDGSGGGNRVLGLPGVVTSFPGPDWEGENRGEKGGRWVKRRFKKDQIQKTVFGGEPFLSAAKKEGFEKVEGRPRTGGCTCSLEFQT